MQILKANNSLKVASHSSTPRKDNLTTRYDVFVGTVVTVVATIACLGSCDTFPVSALEFVGRAVVFAHVSAVGRLVT
jgi:hypothetical protein